jgi:hypothetical protein
VATSNKSSFQKKIEEKIWGDDNWTVQRGILKRKRGRPSAVRSLFQCVGEKLPYEVLNQVRKDFDEEDIPAKGVYIAHDSMGYGRYAGRGNVFSRLKARFKAQRLELKYFSFYIISDKKHEREIETVVIRAAGPQLHFNERKKRVDIQAGDIRDYEAGTLFYERHYKKGRKKRGTG